MNFSTIFQLRTKKFWWMDVIFYFVMSLLVATVLCYLIFLIKDSMQRKDLKDEIAALNTVGTAQQKEYEKEVINYRKKINDFSLLFKNHEFASNVFAFMQQETRPNVWFNRFNMDEKGASVDLSGESDDQEAFARQTAVFEGNEYVKDINVLNSSLGQTSKLQFNFNLSLDQKIFSYIADMSPILETASPTSQSVVVAATDNQANPQAKSSQDLITVFDFPMVNTKGIVNEKNFTVTLNVPFGTKVASLTPSMVISPKATVSPDSGVPQNFTNPISYKVTAEDGSMQNYTVSVNILPKPIAKTGQSSSAFIVEAILGIAIVAIVTLIAFLLYKNKLKKKEQI